MSLPWPVPSEVVAERQKVCEACPELQHKTIKPPLLQEHVIDVCGVCGCWIVGRVRTSCPLKNW